MPFLRKWFASAEWAVGERRPVLTAEGGADTVARSRSRSRSRSRRLAAGERGDRGKVQSGRLGRLVRGALPSTASGDGDEPGVGSSPKVAAGPKAAGAGTGTSRPAPLVGAPSGTAAAERVANRRIVLPERCAVRAGGRQRLTQACQHNAIQKCSHSSHVLARYALQLFLNYPAAALRTYAPTYYLPFMKNETVKPCCSRISQ